MLKETLIVSGLVVFAAAFRACRRNWTRKVGALLFLTASFLFFFFVCKVLWAGFLGVIIWFFLPWIELLTRVRRMRLPLENRLIDRQAPEDDFFPNATRALSAMSDAGFEHVSDAAWSWAGMDQYFRLHWNPEERAVSAVCLCEQEKVAFAFITVTSVTAEGHLYRTTNFPFSPTLKNPPKISWNHVPCERNCFHQILADHHRYLARLGVDPDDLVMPDPEVLGEELEKEKQGRIQFNLEHGIIEPTEDGHFRYSSRGLVFLWRQSVKDMIRLC